MDYDKFIESKIAFINEFLNSTRPAYEIADFMKAFDTIVFRDNDVPESAPTLDLVPEIPAELPVQVECSVKPIVKRGRKKKTIPVIHDGNKPNVHPRSKMVKVSFMERDSYYGSMTAAANALNVTIAQLQYAIKHKKLVNGQEVELAYSDKIFKEKE